MDPLAEVLDRIRDVTQGATFVSGNWRARLARILETPTGWQRLDGILDYLDSCGNPRKHRDPTFRPKKNPAAYLAQAVINLDKELGETAECNTDGNVGLAFLEGGPGETSFRAEKKSPPLSPGSQRERHR